MTKEAQMELNAIAKDCIEIMTAVLVRTWSTREVNKMLRKQNAKLRQLGNDLRLGARGAIAEG
jgi:hypothetical protein